MFGHQQVLNSQRRTALGSRRPQPSLDLATTSTSIERHRLHGILAFKGSTSEDKPRFLGLHEFVESANYQMTSKESGPSPGSFFFLHKKHFQNVVSCRIHSSNPNNVGRSYFLCIHLSKPNALHTHICYCVRAICARSRHR